MRRNGLPLAIVPLALLLAGAPRATAQEPRDTAPAAARQADGFGNEAEAVEAYYAAQQGHYVRAREIAEAILQQDRESIAGHCVLGIVLHRGEGNLPLALFHLKRSRELFEARYGTVPGEDDPWFWHANALAELALVAGEMGRHQEKLDDLAAHDALYEPKWTADRGWPLMRLRRYDEARRTVEAALAMSGRPDQVATAKTALCAIEAEVQDRQASYLACLAAADYDRRQGIGGPTTFTNAAEASLGVLKMDQAERLILEATDRFVVGTVSNPWLDLTLLYLAEGRTAEALDALRRMFAWRNRQPAYMDEQNRAETEMASAVFLLAAGHPQEATRITRRALERPDRTGFTSSETEQMEAAAALLDRAAHRMAAELLAEQASWSPFWPALEARLAAMRERLAAWSSSRRAASLLAADRILRSTLRPYLAGGVEIPEWLEPELCAALGPGVVATALAEARRDETLGEASGYFEAVAAEVASLQGRSRAALRHAEAALDELPGAEAMLLARVAALGAQAALDQGRRERGVELLDRALQLDRAVVRRLGIALPARFEAAPGALAAATLGFLRRSPRFTPSTGGFLVRAEGGADAGRACLLGPQEEVLACAQVTLRAGESTEDLARRLAAELHASAFAPRIDLTQADLRTLDGSPTAAGGRTAERLRGVLDEVVARGGG